MTRWGEPATPEVSPAHSFAHPLNERSPLMVLLVLQLLLPLGLAGQLAYLMFCDGAL